MKRNLTKPRLTIRRGRGPSPDTLRPADEVVEFSPEEEHPLEAERQSDLEGHDHEDHPAEDQTPGEGAAVGDVLGLYLQQMGAIPLLDRDEERELAERLDVARRRYRRAVL